MSDGGLAMSCLRKLRLVVLLMALLLVAVACGRGSGGDADSGRSSDGDDLAKSKVEEIAFASPEKVNDFGWNQQGAEAAEEAARATGAELEVADAAGYTDVAPILQQLADSGADFLIAHASGYNTVGVEVAQQSGIPTVVFDNPDGTNPGVSANIVNRPQEGGYLAGVLAGLMTQTNTLGIAISADATSWNRQAGGFIEGARSVSPDVDIRLSQIGEAGFADVAGGKRVVESLIGAGADIVFGMGDGSSFGMIQAVETAEPPAGADDVWFIDVIGDKTSIDKAGVYLSSVVWEFGDVFKQAIDDINAGTFGEHEYEVSVASGGIHLIQTDHIPADVWSQVQEVQVQVEAGEVEVPNLETKKDVQALINEG